MEDSSITSPSINISVKCLNCSIHCIKDHALLSAENMKLQEENQKLKEQVASLQLEQKENQNNHSLVITKNLAEIDQCELILKNNALRKININLQMAVNELKSSNQMLNSRLTSLETRERSLEFNIASLEEQAKQRDKMINDMAKRIYKFAPVAFRAEIEKFLGANKKIANKTPEEIAYLEKLKQYFRSFVHDQATNRIQAESDEMRGWIQAMFEQKQSISKEFKFKNSKKKIKITLEKKILEEIVQFVEEEEEMEDEEEKEEEEQIE